MSDKFLYLLLGTAFIPLFVLIFLWRKDLQRPMLATGTLVGIWGIISEHYFFQDYWLPPLLYRFGTFGGPEDFLFGFTLGGIAAVGYPLFFNLKFKKLQKPSYGTLLLPIIIQVLCFIAGQRIGINSIYASAIGLAVFALLVWYRRPDLWQSIVVMSLFSALLLIAGESVVLHYAYNTYTTSVLSQYFFLFGKVPLIFNLAPVTELIWAFAFGAAIGPAYAFTTGQTFAQRRRRS
jgi:hypothetical protein